MHQLLAHPLFEERPASEILEPFGFEVNINFTELPVEDETPEAFALYCKNPEAFINEQENIPPEGFTEIARFETEDADIVFVSVRAKTVFARALLCADRDYAGQYSPHNNPFSAIYEERMRQIYSEDFSRDRDDHYTKGELGRAAGAYASIAGNAIERGASHTSNMLTTDWPLDRTWWKPTTPRRDLVKAGALILAEIERLDRAAAYAKAGEVTQ